MNAVLEAFKALLNLGAEFLPEGLRGTVKLVVSLLGGLKLPAGDPRVERVAQLLAEFTGDVTAALQLPDASAREAARLALEHKFLRAWVSLSVGGTE